MPSVDTRGAIDGHLNQHAPVVAVAYSDLFNPIHLCELSCPVLFAWYMRNAQSSPS